MWILDTAQVVGELNRQLLDGFGGEWDEIRRLGIEQVIGLKP